MSPGSIERDDDYGAVFLRRDGAELRAAEAFAVAAPDSPIDGLDMVASDERIVAAIAGAASRLSALAPASFDPRAYQGGLLGGTADLLAELAALYLVRRGWGVSAGPVMGVDEPAVDPLGDEFYAPAYPPEGVGSDPVPSGLPPPRRRRGGARGMLGGPGRLDVDEGGGDLPASGWWNPDGDPEPDDAAGRSRALRTAVTRTLTNAEHGAVVGAFARGVRALGGPGRLDVDEGGTGPGWGDDPSDYDPDPCPFAPSRFGDGDEGEPTGMEPGDL